MYIDTKKGLVCEPKAEETQSLYKWLEKYKAALDGSRAYEELVEIYEAIDFDLSNQK